MKKIILTIILCACTFLSVYADKNKTSAIEKMLLRKGLVDIQTIDQSIKVDLKYSSADNFLGKDIYGEMDRCYLRKNAAVKLTKAQKMLQRLKPGYSLLVFDGVRPRRFQFMMWKLVQGTKSQMYVANPYRGSIHNYGAAVDLTIVDENGRMIDMGTPFDSFKKLAQPRHEAFFLKNGKLSKKQFKNRMLLRDIMETSGFRHISIEWWHFNSLTLKSVRRRYSIIE